MNKLRSALAAAGCAALVLSSCAIGNKQSQADLIDRAPTLAAKAKTVRGTMTVELVARDRPPTSTPAGAAGLAAATPQKFSMEIPVGFDFASDRVALIIKAPATGDSAEAAAASGAAAPAPAPAPSPAEEIPATAIFHDGEIVVKRSNLRPTERRPWAKLDFTVLPSNEPAPDPDDLPGPLGLFWAANTINPSYILDLARGTLAGSIKVLGRETVGAVETTHFQANISRDQATTKLKLTDDEQNTRQLMFRLLSVRNDIVRGEFWVDRQGLLRRMKVRLPERFRRTLSNDLNITLDLPEYGVVVQVPAPSKEETLQLERYGALVRTVTPKIQ